MENNLQPVKTPCWLKLKPFLRPLPFAKDEMRKRRPVLMDEEVEKRRACWRNMVVMIMAADVVTVDGD